MKGVIFNMQGYSVHDGPGIRTLVFIKGCPLRCTWCCNPESQRREMEPAWATEKCLGCGRCITVCPAGALSSGGEGILINRTRCMPDACGKLCEAICLAKAITVYGKEYTPQKVLDRVERDSAFYARSGGGMTVSGGEPLSQPEFLLAILEEAEKRAINTAMETCGFSPRNTLLAAAAKLDYLLFDIKHMDPAIHKRFTGISNERILKNLRDVCAAYPSLPVHIRTPVISGVNDTEEAIRDIAAFARSCGAMRYELLPFHRMGEQKYRRLGLPYAFEGQPNTAQEILEPLEAAALAVFPDSAEHG